MAILYDTNILIALITKSNFDFVHQTVNPNKEDEYISYVSYAEIKSIAFQNQWVERKLEQLDEIISKFNIINVNSESLLERYVEIDAFSQGKHPNFILEVTARNMGKHDLWISATASLLGLNLVTTDADFDHLAQDFVQLYKFTPQELVFKNNL